MCRLLPFPFLLFLIVCSANAQIAPGGPGADAEWPTAAKQGIGTANSAKSKVWFTLAQGVMTEVYYPDVATANVQMLQFVVVDPKTRTVETERDDAISMIKPISASWEKDFSLIANINVERSFHSESSLVFSQTSTSKSGRWRIEKLYVADPDRSTVMIRVALVSDEDLQLYVDYDPSLANSGLHDSGWIAGRDLIASDGNVASALTCGRCKFHDAVTGFVGVNDGLTQLRKYGTIHHPYERAENGNIAQVAGIEPVRIGHNRSDMVFSLGFGSNVNQAAANAHDSLESGFDKVMLAYQLGWVSYLKKVPAVEPKFQPQFNMAAMVLKALEDKAHPGANVASLSIPWGGGPNANDDHLAGYHYVWSRDLYEVVTAYMALGDTAAANRALDFLFSKQQKPDGSFPQVSLLDGKLAWGGVQMDEVSYPLILAYQLERNDKQIYSLHVKPAADYIMANGPSTPQERWEEKAGYSPSTIAAEIAGLVCAAEIAKKNGDDASATRWLATADNWARNVERWTATTNGKYGDGHYYIRLSEKGEPDAGHKIELNNNAGTFQENEIVDAGFLELVRLGIKPADDPLIVKSVRVVDDVLKVDTPNGAGFYRYNHDGYGEMDDGRRWNWDGKYTGKGRLWPLLSGERGEYELALCSMQSAVVMSEGKVQATDYGDSRCPRNFESRLATMAGFANDGLMISEQVWDRSRIPERPDKQFVPELKFGEGTGSATPLAWSMAQFIRLALNIKAGHNLETPQVVFERYKNGVPSMK